LNNEEDHGTGVAVSQIKSNTETYSSNRPIVDIKIKLDQFIDYWTIERATYILALGNVGGLQSFYAFLILAMIDYFINIDYMANIIKQLFLEKQTDKKFYQKYVED
jgi:hypothetical protein